MRQIRHTGVFVDDLERMKDFYCRHFNMEAGIHDTEVGDYIASLYGLGNKKVEVELYKLATQDGCMVELLKYVPEGTGDAHAKTVFEKGCAHIAFTVKSVEEAYAELRNDDGIEFLSGPLLSRDKKHKVCFCKDPEGNYLELVEEL